MKINDEYIKTHCLNKKGNINSSWTRHIYMENHPAIKQYLLNRYPDSSCIHETLYRILHCIETRPVCKNCGKPITFGNKEFMDFCCTSCSKQYIETNNVNTDISIEDIISDIIQDNEINYNKVKEKYLIEHGYKEILLDQFPNEKLKYVEILYRLYHKLNGPDLCKTCGKPLKFINFSKGYGTYCSKACELNDTITINDEYVRNYLIGRGLQNHISNLKATGIYNYLITRFKDCSNYKEAIYRIKNKLETAPLCPVCGKPLKYSEALRGYRKYCCRKCESIVERQTRLDTIRKHTGFDIELDPKHKDHFIFHNCCDKHKEFSIDVGIAHNRTMEDRYKSGCICPICNPVDVQTSKIELIVQSVLDQNHINYIQHCRTVIRPLEVDFYMPEHNLCIECNGSFWHSTIKHTKNYHHKKYLKVLETGNTLLSFWEDDILNKPEIIENLILLHCRERNISKDLQFSTSENNNLEILKNNSLYAKEIISLYGDRLKCYKAMCDDKTIAYLYGYEDKNNFTVVELIYNTPYPIYSELLNSFTNYIKNNNLYKNLYIKLYNDTYNLKLYNVEINNSNYIEHKRNTDDFEQYDTGIRTCLLFNKQYRKFLIYNENYKETTYIFS